MENEVRKFVGKEVLQFHVQFEQDALLLGAAFEANQNRAQIEVLRLNFVVLFGLLVSVDQEGDQSEKLVTQLFAFHALEFTADPQVPETITVRSFFAQVPVSNGNLLQFGGFFIFVIKQEVLHDLTAGGVGGQHKRTLVRLVQLVPAEGATVRFGDQLAAQVDDSNEIVERDGIRIYAARLEHHFHHFDLDRVLGLTEHRLLDQRQQLLYELIFRFDAFLPPMLAVTQHMTVHAT